jgi:hypothetical protein
MDDPDRGEGWMRVSGPAGGEDPGSDPRVAAIVRLLHRRRGWAWTLGASLVAFVGFVALLTSLWPNATGEPDVISGFIIILLLALAVVALTAVITDTVRLRRREPSIRARGTFGGPVRHRARYVLGWVALSAFPLLTVAILPRSTPSHTWRARAVP